MEATPLSAFAITGTRIDRFVGNGITEVVIPEGITEIKHHAFCPAINPAAATVQSVYLPDSVIIIGESAFSSAKNLAKVRLPSNLEELKRGTFEGCESLQSIWLPQGLRSIGFHAFSSTKISEIILPDTVTTLEKGAISFCLHLKTITVPENVRIIGDEVFYYSLNLTIQTTSGAAIEFYAKQHRIPVKILTDAAISELLTAQKSAFPSYPQLEKETSGKSDQSASQTDEDVELRKVLDELGLTREDLEEVIRSVNESEDPAEGTSREAKPTDQYVSPHMKEIEKLIADLGKSQSAQEEEKQHRFSSLVSAVGNWLRQRNAPSKDDENQYSELIRFVKFCKQIAPLAKGNYGITITHEPEQSINLVAAFGFYDLNEIQFAREFAMDRAHKDLNKQMIHRYYEEISKAAGLSQEDWPYCIDADAFRDVLLGEFWDNRFTVIPDERDEDILTLQVVGGISYSNAAQVHASVIKLLNYHFPELNIKRGYVVSPTSMRIHFNI